MFKAHRHPHPSNHLPPTSHGLARPPTAQVLTRVVTRSLCPNPTHQVQFLAISLHISFSISSMPRGGKNPNTSPMASAPGPIGMSPKECGLFFVGRVGLQPWPIPASPRQGQGSCSQGWGC